MQRDEHIQIKDGNLRYMSHGILLVILMGAVALSKGGSDGNHIGRGDRCIDSNNACYQVRTEIPTITPTPVPQIHEIGDAVQVRAEAFTITSYGASYNGQPLGCSGAGNYASSKSYILAVGPSNYERWPCGIYLNVCGPVGCLAMERVDSCPGCNNTMLDTSESGYAILCGEDASGPCPVIVKESIVE